MFANRRSINRHTDSSNKTIWVVLIGLVLFLVLTIGGCAAVKAGFTETETFTITEKERVQDRYLVFTDKDTYEITDSWVYFRFNSSDLYGELKVGQKYECKTFGIRFGFTSTYENLIECKEVE